MNADALASALAARAAEIASTGIVIVAVDETILVEVERSAYASEPFALNIEN